MLILTRHPSPDRARFSGVQVGDAMLRFTEADCHTATVEIHRGGFVDVEVLHLKQDMVLDELGARLCLFRARPNVIKVGIRTIRGVKILREELVERAA